jgi:hypothetical protein
MRFGIWSPDPHSKLGSKISSNFSRYLNSKLVSRISRIGEINLREAYSPIPARLWGIWNVALEYLGKLEFLYSKRIWGLNIVSRWFILSEKEKTRSKKAHANVA